MNTTLSRRRFLSHSVLAGCGAATAGASLALHCAESSDPLPEPTALKLPRWRGFNLLSKFNGQNRPFPEEDFARVAQWGFNFVRLPMDYRGWVEEGDWTRFRESTLKEIDAAVQHGQKHRVHVCLNFHRAPGYTVARPGEAKSLWSDDEALRVCALHWGTFAKRYQGIPNRNLSFNLLNEPPKLEPGIYRKTIARLTEAIREQDRDRLIICDGRDWGNTPPDELAGLSVACAARGYAPFKLTHYLASWANNGGRWEKPTYPLQEGGTLWDKATLKLKNIQPWKALEARGVVVMVGEFGSFNKTPHAVVLDWMRDCLALWKEAGWGWALWNLEGGFGILDSGREDVAYEDFHGHKLDKQMLNLLQAS